MARVDSTTAVARVPEAELRGGSRTVQGFLSLICRVCFRASGALAALPRSCVTDGSGHWGVRVVVTGTGQPQSASGSRFSTDSRQGERSERTG